MRSLTFVFFMFLISAATAEPLFPNSVVSNDLEFLTTEDESAFYCLKYFGTDTREMPDKRHEELMASGVHDFEAWFNDGTTIGIWIHPDLGDQVTAETVVRRVAGPLGRLPSFMRERLRHVVIHDGDETAFAEDAGRFFVLYNDNIARRLQTNDLEETVFHEAVHATLDIPFSASPRWLAAQREDGDFVTDYAKSKPDGEDLAETALFAYAYHQHPDRLPDAIRMKLEHTIPNRLAFLEKFFGPTQKMQRPVDGLEVCDG